MTIIESIILGRFLIFEFYLFDRTHKIDNDSQELWSLWAKNYSMDYRR
ncbi:hypothetical protein [Geminocystis sp. CENA526]